MRCIITLGLALFAAGCADDVHVASPAETARLERDTHIDDLPRGKSDPGDAVVRVVAHGSFCSGALVGDAVVVTAQHCVSELDDDGIKTLTPGYVHIELGKDALPWGRVGAREVLVCEGWEGGAACDVAVIVLAKRVPFEVPRLRVGLDDDSRSLATNAPLVARGFGIGMRMRTMPLSGLATWSTHRVESAGAFTWSDDDIVASTVPTALGDSGGPILAEGTDVVLGVASRGREGNDDTPPLTMASRLAPCRETLARAAELEMRVGS